MKAGTRRLLEAMLENGGVPASRVPAGSRRDLDPLLHSGAIRRRRAGAGSRYEVRDADAVCGLLRRYAPETEPDPGLTARANAVRLHRTTKTAAPEAPYVAILRAPSAPCLWRDGETVLDAADLSGRYGAAALTLSVGDRWHSDRPLALVENREAFFHAERLPGLPEPITFLYYAGHLDNALIDWLAARERSPRLLLLPDFDPVGLHNLLRLRRRLGRSVELPVPAGFSDLLRRYGDPKLLRRGERVRAYLRELRVCGDPQIAGLLSELQQAGCGLEQEALLQRVSETDVTGA